MSKHCAWYVKRNHCRPRHDGEAGKSQNKFPLTYHFARVHCAEEDRESADVDVVVKWWIMMRGTCAIDTMTMDVKAGGSGGARIW
jgi:hypothetical protein